MKLLSPLMTFVFFYLFLENDLTRASHRNPNKPSGTNLQRQQMPSRFTQQEAKSTLKQLTRPHPDEERRFEQKTHTVSSVKNKTDFYFFASLHLISFLTPLHGFWKKKRKEKRKAIHWNKASEKTTKGIKRKYNHHFTAQNICREWKTNVLILSFCLVCFHRYDFERCNKCL